MSAATAAIQNDQKCQGIPLFVKMSSHGSGSTTPTGVSPVKLCGFCNLPGHNASTCEKRISAQAVCGKARVMEIIAQNRAERKKAASKSKKITLSEVSTVEELVQRIAKLEKDVEFLKSVFEANMEMCENVDMDYLDNLENAFSSKVNLDD